MHQSYCSPTFTTALMPDLPYHSQYSMAKICRNKWCAFLWHPLPRWVTSQILCVTQLCPLATWLDLAGNVQQNSMLICLEIRAIELNVGIYFQVNKHIVVCSRFLGIVTVCRILWGKMSVLKVLWVAEGRFYAWAPLLIPGSSRFNSWNRIDMIASWWGNGLLSMGY